MKIKLLKDIPGYKAGEEIEPGEYSLGVNIVGGGKGIDCHYNYDYLLKNGWAEEIKDDIDIDDIRRNHHNFVHTQYLSSTKAEFEGISVEECRWFKSYRTICAVIEKLNAQSDTPRNFEFMVQRTTGDILMRDRGNKMYRCGILPMMTKECALKVVELCTSELKVIFPK